MNANIPAFRSNNRFTRSWRPRGGCLIVPGSAELALFFLHSLESNCQMYLLFMVADVATVYMCCGLRHSEVCASHVILFFVGGWCIHLQPGRYSRINNASAPTRCLVRLCRRRRRRHRCRVHLSVLNGTRR